MTDITLTAVESRPGRDEVVITVCISDGVHSENRILVIAVKMYFEILNIGVGSLPCKIDVEKFDLLEYNAKLWSAVKKGIDLLAFGDNSRARLARKLRERGFEAELSAEAAEYLSKLGYINEERQLESSFRTLERKGFGPSRIRAELIKKGIPRSIIDESLPELLGEIDFDERLEEILVKKYDTDELSDPKYREKVTAALFRYGYSPSDTRAVIRRILNR